MSGDCRNRKFRCFSFRKTLLEVQVDQRLVVLGAESELCKNLSPSRFGSILIEKVIRESRGQIASSLSAFLCRRGLFQWNVMPFGLCGAPATFERLMETVLRGLQWRTCLLYLDDIIIFGRTFEELLARQKEVMEHLREAGMKLKANKCLLFQPSVQFLGHVVSADRIHTDPEKVKAI